MLKREVLWCFPFFCGIACSLPIDALADKQVHIVSDGALFLIYTSEHSVNYPELEFWAVTRESLEQYDDVPEFLLRKCGE